MSVLILGEVEKRLIAQAIELARDQYLPWSIGQRHFIDDRDKPTNEFKLEDRRSDLSPASQKLILGSYRCAISFEEQPAGMCRHLSISVAASGKMPNEIAVKFLTEAFGFTSGWPPTRGRIYLEEFEPGHHAVNIVEVEP